MTCPLIRGVTKRNTIVYNKFDYDVSLRKRLAKPTNWMDVLKVKYSNAYKITGGYMSTEPGPYTGTRGTAYSLQDFVITNDTLTISTYKSLGMFVDEADRYQQSYSDQIKIAEYQGKKISEYIESQMLAQHGSWTNFGQTDLDNTGQDDDTAITVSAANIDDIIRAVKRKLYTHNLVDYAVDNGIFFAWRPEDFELLEAFVQANGFREADIALKNGIPVQRAFRYLGVDHYLSTQHTAGHVFCGIKNTFEIGILRGTFGKSKMIEDPSLQSGIGIHSRIDYGWNAPAQLADAFMDLRVA